MRKFSNLNLRGELLKHTQKKPITRNATRWSSTYNIITRYFFLKESFEKVSVFKPEIVGMMLTPLENQELASFTPLLEQVNLMCLALQEDNPPISLAAVRRGFDYLIYFLEKDDLARYLKKNADIVHSPDFENALVAIQENSDASLSPAELESIYLFKKPVLQSVATHDLHAALRTRQNEGASYSPTSWIPATSNLCERFFSMVKNTFVDSRASSYPRSIEEVMFARVNQSLWCNEFGGLDIVLEDNSEIISESESE